MRHLATNLYKAIKLKIYIKKSKNIVKGKGYVEVKCFYSSKSKQQQANDKLLLSCPYYTNDLNCQKNQRILSIGWTWKNYTGKIFVIYSFSKVVHLVNLILMTNVLRDFDFFLAFS